LDEYETTPIFLGLSLLMEMCCLLFVDAINKLIVEEIEKWDVKVIESCKA